MMRTKKKKIKWKTLNNKDLHQLVIKIHYKIKVKKS